MGPGPDGTAGDAPTEEITGTPAAGDVDDSAPGGPPEPDDDARVLLFMRPGRNRELLVETLRERYAVETTTDVEALETTFDCCVFDAHEFNRVAGTIQSRRELSAPVFIPFVLLVSDEAVGMAAGNAWEYVDDIIELPVRKAALRSRIANLVERRRTSLRLAERERRLADTVEDLRLKEQAMDQAPVGITIAESGDDDNPLVYTNDGFEELTGYGSDAFGTDCRFLQGDETDSETRAALRSAIDAEEPISVDILNYRRNGQTFWNRLTVAPLRDENGSVTNYVGFQTDITDRKIRERRLEVMSRVLNHNLRNKMNLIEGYTAMLREELRGHDVEDEPIHHALGVIEETATDLMGIADAVRKIDHTLAEPSTELDIDLSERLPELVSRMTDRYPAATFELSLPDPDSPDPLMVRVVGLVTAVEEAVENAVKHNEDPDPTVKIRVERRGSDWIEIEIEDDGPGIPDHETRVLEHGETSLTHADRLGIWLMYWVVNKAGGEFSVSTGDAGTTLRLTVPIAP
ncbi:PAS domain-containing protein [Halorubrum trueperi]|uniref:PAS domain-containing protein n=1 Tax=Halorubrum trueperi TaxID=2004704 RepID=A0ABD5UPH5_9EURY